MDTFGSDAANRAPDVDAGEDALVQLEHVSQQFVQVRRYRARRRHARELRELVDQRLQ